MATFWACARTHPCKEKLAIINLRRQDFTAFFPFFLIRNRRGLLTPQAAFPGYVFIKLDDTARWAPINFTLGVQRLLTNPPRSENDYRTPCRADFINDLHKMRIFGDESAKAAPDIIPPGTVIKIKRGPFATREALVQMSTAQRVRVLLQAFNREIVLECEAADIERAPLSNVV